MLSPSARDSEVQEFILDNRAEDVSKLMLRRPGKKDWDWLWIGQQIEGFQKAKKKLPKLTEQSEILFPKRLSLEQCSSEASAEFKIRKNVAKTVLDLSGGFGVDTIAFAQSGAKVDYVEKDEDLCELMIHNSKSLGLSDQIQIYNSGAKDFLIENKGSYDLVFVDPARRDDLGKKVFRFEDCSPDIVDLQEEILKYTNQILVKAAPMLDISQGIRDLENVSDVWILSNSRECKELLFLIIRDFVDAPKIHCCQLNSEIEFSFQFGDEREQVAEFRTEGKYYYLPNPSIMKSGAFRTLGNQFGMALIHPNTHILVSNESVEDFPGRRLKVEEILNFTTQNSFQESRYTVILRNFPHSIEEIHKKIQIKEGNEGFLLFFRDTEENLRTAICSRA